MDSPKILKIKDSDEIFTTSFGPVTYRRITNGDGFQWLRPDGTAVAPIIIPHLEREYSRWLVNA